MMKNFINSCYSSAAAFRFMTFGSFVRYSKYAAKRYFFKKYIPGTAIIAVTFRCQCNCECCSASFFQKIFQDVPDMPIGQLKKVIVRIAKAGVPRLHFTGGEPLLYRDIVEAVAEAGRFGLLTFLETNGLLLKEEMVRRLKKAKVSCINISLDNVSADTHDSLRRVEGCFTRVVEAIELCKKLRQRCMLSAYATKENIRDNGLQGLIRFARDKGCSGVRIIAPQPSGKWLRDDNVILSKDDEKAVASMVPFGFMVLNRTRLIRCPLKNAYKLFILPDGNIAPCEHLPFIFKDSKDIDYSDLVSKIRSYGMFRGDHYCLPRDARFREAFLKEACPDGALPRYI